MSEHTDTVKQEKIYFKNLAVKLQYLFRFGIKLQTDRIADKNNKITVKLTHTSHDSFGS